MAYPTIVVNQSTGSDTGTSGAGPATALTGTNASYSGTTVTLDGSPDLSGVATDGSHALFLATSTGRRFFRITGTDNTAKTVTVETAPTGTTTGLTWAIGGKRATLNHSDTRNLFSASAPHLWTVEIQDTGSPYTLTGSALTIGDASFTVTIIGTGSSRPEIRQTADAPGIQFSAPNSAPTLHLRRLKLTNSNASKTAAVGVYRSGSSAGNLFATDCVFGDVTNRLSRGLLVQGAGSRLFRVTQSTIEQCTSDGLWIDDGNTLYAHGCLIRTNGGHGLYLYGSATLVLLDSIVAYNTNAGVVLDPGGYTVGPLIHRCSIHANGSHGISFASASVSANAVFGGSVLGCILTSNGGYGLSAVSATPAPIVDYNGVGLNTSGGYSGVSAGANDVTLTAVPFVDPTNGDFSLNTTSGGGAACRDAGWPRQIGAL